jgi:hypothetical protein
MQPCFLRQGCAAAQPGQWGASPPPCHVIGNPKNEIASDGAGVAKNSHPEKLTPGKIGSGAKPAVDCLLLNRY